MKISIITVCLNSKKTIEQTIQSVISQNDENLEYIIIDGQSSDGTLEIINGYKTDVTKIISESDKGIYDAMNKGISIATGDVVGIINSDDWYEEGVFKNVRKCFLSSGADVVYGKLNLINENKIVQQLLPSDIKKIRYEMPIPHPTVFIKRNIYENYGTFSLEYKIAADYDLMLRFYVKGVRFAYIDKILANFRLNGISNQQTKICTCETLHISKKYLVNIPLAEREYFEKIIIHRWNVFYFKELLDVDFNKYCDIIKMFLKKENKEKIAIFGAGRWGIDSYYVLKKGKLLPSLLVDNDEKLWNMYKSEVLVSAPDVLKYFRGVLLILVKDFCEEIKLQIKQINNPEIICITWKEIVNEFKSFFP